MKVLQMLCIFLYVFLNNAEIIDVKKNLVKKKEILNKQHGCVCGVFLSSQLKRNNKAQPTGNPAIAHEISGNFPCNYIGDKFCTNRCLELIVKYLPKSPVLLCKVIEHDCIKEKAYLFIKNCQNQWINTNFSAGKKYCCKNRRPYKCPII